MSRLAPAVWAAGWRSSELKNAGGETAATSLQRSEVVCLVS